MLKDDQAMGKIVELYGLVLQFKKPFNSYNRPREYHFKRLAQLWLDVTQREISTVPLPKAIFK